MSLPDASHRRATARPMTLILTCAALAAGAAGCARGDGGDGPSSTTTASVPSTPTGVTAPSTSSTSSTSSPTVVTATETATATATATASSSSASTATDGPSAPTGAGGTGGSTTPGTAGPSGSASTGSTGGTGSVVSTSGYGGYTFGMSQASAVAKARSEGYAVSTAGACTIMKKSGIALVGLDGKLGLISVDGPIRTDRGVGVGTSFAAVKKAYPAAVYQDVARLVDRSGSIASVFTFSQEQGGSVVTYLVGSRAAVDKTETCQ